MTKRFPDDYSRGELIELVHYHHKGHVESTTKLSKTTKKLISAQKELSRLKRNV